MCTPASSLWNCSSTCFFTIEHHIQIASITCREWQREIDQIISPQTLLWYTEEIYLRCKKDFLDLVLRIMWCWCPWLCRCAFPMNPDRFPCTVDSPSLLNMIYRQWKVIIKTIMLEVNNQELMRVSRSRIQLLTWNSKMQKQVRKQHLARTKI